MQAVYLRVQLVPDYLGTTTVNGEWDEQNSQILFSLWHFRIRLIDGVVIDWPPDMTAQLYHKISDRGQYWLQDANGNDIAKYRRLYVPDSFLCYGVVGNGDFICMDIGSDGVIAEYIQPTINLSDWDTSIQFNSESARIEKLQAENEKLQAELSMLRVELVTLRAELASYKDKV